MANVFPVDTRMDLPFLLHLDVWPLLFRMIHAEWDCFHIHLLHLQSHIIAHVCLRWVCDNTTSLKASYGPECTLPKYDVETWNLQVMCTDSRLFNEGTSCVQQLNLGNGLTQPLLKWEFGLLIKCRIYEPDRGLTASGCARPRCHVIAICTQDWLTSGRVAMIISMLIASLSFGGGCLIVQGVLGTQAHQSNWRNISRERVSGSPSA